MPAPLLYRLCLAFLIAPLLAVEPTHAEVRYGGATRNVCDLWLAPGDAASPAVIYFHGGGFVQGDKAEAARSIPIDAYLRAGVSVVSANYRYVTESPFPAPFLDGARVVQFIRARARDFRIDPRRIALMGGSAGGNMALVIAFSPDRRDEAGADAVLRESTAVRCVVALSAQCSNDLAFLRTHIYDGPTLPPFLLACYGVDRAADLLVPPASTVAARCSAIELAGTRSPPVYLEYAGPLTATPLHEGTEQGVYLHHPRWGELLQQRLDSLGVACAFHHAGNPPPHLGKEQFLRRHLLGRGDD